MMFGPLMAISPTVSGSSSTSDQSGLISFISTPGIGMPIDPTRTSSPSGEKLATGDVSDSP
jgi:hypothetical protein